MRRGRGKTIFNSEWASASVGLFRFGVSTGRPHRFASRDCLPKPSHFVISRQLFHNPIQDAVAAANELSGPLREGAVSDENLAKIQRRRAFPTRLTRRLQELLRRQVGRGIGKSGSTRPPWPGRLLERTTLLCRLRTRFVGVGIRPEHVKTPDVYK